MSDDSVSLAEYDVLDGDGLGFTCAFCLGIFA